MATTSLTAEVADYLAAAEYDTVPADVRRQAAVVLRDTIGVILGASLTATMSELYDQTARRQASSEATVLGRAARDSAENAAFLNAVAGHNIELDDSHGPSMTHAAANLVATALAVAELEPAVSMKRVLTGIVAGYDVISRLSQAIGVQVQYDRGFFPSSVCGSVAAAACASVVLGLDAAAVERALSLGASQSCGLLAYADDPSHTAKAFQIGIAARNGVHAALVARTGFGGRVDVLGGRHSLIRTFGDEASNADVLVSELGSSFEIMRTSLKRFACCRQAHAALDGLLDILETEQVPATDIERIDVQLSTSAVARVDHNPLWTHNLQYLMALASRERVILPNHFTDRWTSDPDIAALARRVYLTASTELQTAWPVAKGANVALQTRGARFERVVPLAVGDPGRPLSATMQAQKFAALAASSALTDKAVDELSALLTENLAAVPVSDLTGHLRGDEFSEVSRRTLP